MKQKNSRSKPFIETRNHHLLELAEDYLEVILDLISLKGEARVTDIANDLGVSHVTVIRTLKRLNKKGYIDITSHQPVQLTEKGETIAKFSKERHLFLLHYLKALGVPEDIAAIDVEGMEHHISSVTMNAFQKHLKTLEIIQKPSLTTV